MDGCQNYGPFLGTLNIRCRIIIGTQKGTIILRTTHIFSGLITIKTRGLGLRVQGAVTKTRKRCNPNPPPLRPNFGPHRYPMTNIKSGPNLRDWVAKP